MFYGTPPIVTNGLVLNLDCGNRLSYPTSGTTWTDLSGFANNGTLTNGPTYNPNNLGSIVFDGVDDYSLISNTNLLTFGNNSFSINFWMRPINFLTGYKTILSNYDSYSSDYASYFYCAIFNGSGLGFNGELTILDSTGNWYAGIPRVSLVNNEWVNIVITRTENIITIYKNTSPTVGSGTSNLNFSGIRSTKIFGGISSIGSTQGNLSTIQIYNRALSQSEVLQNYNAYKSRFGLT